MTPNSNTEELQFQRIADLKRQVFEQERDHLISDSTHPSTGKKMLVYGLPISEDDAERIRQMIKRRFVTHFVEIHLLLAALIIAFAALIFGFQLLFLPY